MRGGLLPECGRAAKRHGRILRSVSGQDISLPRSRAGEPPRESYSISMEVGQRNGPYDSTIDDKMFTIRERMGTSAVLWPGSPCEALSRPYRFVLHVRLEVRKEYARMELAIRYCEM